MSEKTLLQQMDKSPGQVLHAEIQQTHAETTYKPLAERLREAQAEVLGLNAGATWHEIQREKLGRLAAERAMQLNMPPDSNWNQINQRVLEQILAFVDPANAANA